MVNILRSTLITCAVIECRQQIILSQLTLIQKVVYSVNSIHRQICQIFSSITKAGRLIIWLLTRVYSIPLLFLLNAKYFFAKYVKKIFCCRSVVFITQLHTFRQIIQGLFYIVVPAYLEISMIWYLALILNQTFCSGWFDNNLCLMHTTFADKIFTTRITCICHILIRN